MLQKKNLWLQHGVHETYLQLEKHRVEHSKKKKMKMHEIRALLINIKLLKVNNKSK